MEKMWNGKVQNKSVSKNPSGEPEPAAFFAEMGGIWYKDGESAALGAYCYPACDVVKFSLEPTVVWCTAMTWITTRGRNYTFTMLTQQAELGCLVSRFRVGHMFNADNIYHIQSLIAMYHAMYQTNTLETTEFMPSLNLTTIAFYPILRLQLTINYNNMVVQMSS